MGQMDSCKMNSQSIVIDYRTTNNIPRLSLTPRMVVYARCNAISEIKYFSVLLCALD